MISVVFYDPASGAISQSGQMSPQAAVAAGRPYIVVDRYSVDLDGRFRVANGALEAITVKQ